MFRRLLKQKTYIAAILAFIILEPSLNSALNFLLRRLFDSAQVGADKLMLLRLLTAGFLLWIVKRVVIFISGTLRARYLCNIKEEMKHDMFTHMMGDNGVNISSFASGGEYISAFTNDINLLETRYFTQVIGLVSGIISILIMASSFLALNAKLAGVVLIFSIITLVIPKFFEQMLNRKNLRYSERIAAFTQRIKEFSVGYPMIKNYAIEPTIVKKFDNVNAETEDSKFEADYALNLSNSIGQLMCWFIQLLSVGIGLMLVANGEILIGTVVSAQSFAADLASPLQSIVSSINSIGSMKKIVRNMEALMESAPTGPTVSLSEPQSGCEEAAPLSPDSLGEGPVEFRDVCLTISQKPIINHFSFRFEPNRKYLVVGLNGSGKSTLFKALKRWYPECSGEILINGVPVSAIPGSILSNSVSYMNENVSLLSGTVRDNITLFQSCDEEKLTAAVRDAKVQLDLNREIDDEGRNISSGEQRRIEIARSLLKSAKLLIFDEVVSTLDIETAYEIEKMVLAYPDKTVVFVSHNFSGKLLDRYDEILVMDSGRLLAHGSSKELLRSCEYFRRICGIKFGPEAA